ncbi:hypothetical protein Ga0466249_002558 [Sporomusaceae bacterium BoRhaA]|nr:hypothetical protein [Pelorhabdus rhamnosifermentans]
MFCPYGNPYGCPYHYRPRRKRWWNYHPYWWNYY